MDYFEIGPNAGSSSKIDIGRQGRAFQKLTRDDTVSSSVHTVVSNDDLLIEILLLLPVTSLILFKSVSKRWFSIIKSSDFISRRNIICNLDPPSGVFYEPSRDTGLGFEYDFVSFDIRIPSKRSVSFSFGSEVPANVVILDSCNGLYLCTEKSLDKYEYYVYNPSINLYKMIPHNSINYTNCIIRLAFDPTKSPHYKVVIAGSDRVGYYPYQIATYSSETNNWSVYGDELALEFFRGFGSGVYWNGAFHWINSYITALKPFHFMLNIVNTPVLTTIKPSKHWKGRLVMNASYLSRVVVCFYSLRTVPIHNC